MIKYNYTFTEDELDEQTEVTAGLKDMADAVKKCKPEAQETEDNDDSSQD